MLNTQKVLPPDWKTMGETAKLFTRSLMMGLDSAVRKAEFDEPSAEDIENMPYHEAVEYLKKRDVIKKVDYDSLSDKMRFRAFTASRIADGDLLKKLNAEMIASVNDGRGLSDFLSLTKTDILDKIGMGAGSGWYYETVYRTNVQTAYNVGRAMGFAEDKPLALELVIIDDSRTSDICRQYAGKRFILPYDHPFWQTHWPPFHFNCRTTIRAIYDESELPENWSNPKDIEDANNGFGAYPLAGDGWWNELASQVARAKEYGVQGEILGAKRALRVDEPTKEELIQKAKEAIEQKQNEAMPDRIYGYSEMKPKEKRTAVCNWLIRKGMMSGKERIFITSSDGKPVFIRLGEAHSVSLKGMAGEKLLAAKKNTLILFHNHPFSGSFSFKDAQTLNRFSSLKEMLAVGHNGTVYSLKVGKRLSEKEFAIFGSTCTEPDLIKILVKKYKWIYTESKRS